MKIFVHFLITAIFSLFFYSCDPCLGSGFNDCTAPFSFKIINKISGEDLVFGTNPMYAKDSIYLFTNLQGLNGPMSYIDSNKFTSMLRIPVDTLFLHLGQSETDTLLMSYKFGKKYCCRYPTGYGKLKEIKINNKVLLTENSIFLIEK